MRKQRVIPIVVLMTTFASAACQGGKQTGLESSGSGTLKVRKKGTKEEQIEAIKAEMIREGVTAEQASAVEGALGKVADVDDPAEQARLLLASLSEALTSLATNEILRDQIAHVVMGAAADLGRSLASEAAPRLIQRHCARACLIRPQGVWWRMISHLPQLWRRPHGSSSKSRGRQPKPWLP